MFLPIVSLGSMRSTSLRIMIEIKRPRVLLEPPFLATRANRSVRAVPHDGATCGRDEFSAGVAARVLEY